MASREVHLAQAGHNERFADELTQTMRYKDWVITAAFYAAVHYAEAFFFSIKGVKHSETSVPRDERGKPRVSLHTWRKTVLLDHCTGVAYTCYRNLQEASETARYLCADDAFLPATACDFFPDDQVRSLLDIDLSNFKQQVGF